MLPRTHDGVTKHLDWHDRWSVRPVRYYLIDFGLSRYYPKEPIEAETLGTFGQDATVPELLVDQPFNPFKVDVYQLGNVFIETIEKYEGLEPLLPLARAMTSHNPEDRPSPSQALQMLGPFTHEKCEARVWRKTCTPEDRYAIAHPEKGLPYYCLA
ncbi:hypothetical protein H0H92_010606 [Tricholoma furcatifolium]|nr:hypothetical protein H0H92_010606 [Tricholoma furcatifolium]